MFNYFFIFVSFNIKKCLELMKENLLIKFLIMVEPLLSGIVLGLVPVTIAGLLVTAYLQYRRGDSLNF